MGAENPIQVPENQRPESQAKRPQQALSEAQIFTRREAVYRRVRFEGANGLKKDSFNPQKNKLNHARIIIGALMQTLDLALKEGVLDWNLLWQVSRDLTPEGMEPFIKEEDVEDSDRNYYSKLRGIKQLSKKDSTNTIFFEEEGLVYLPPKLVAKLEKTQMISVIRFGLLPQCRVLLRGEGVEGPGGQQPLLFHDLQRPLHITKEYTPEKDKKKKKGEDHTLFGRYDGMQEFNISYYWQKVEHWTRIYLDHVGEKALELDSKYRRAHARLYRRFHKIYSKAARNNGRRETQETPQYYRHMADEAKNIPAKNKRILRLYFLALRALRNPREGQERKSELVGFEIFKEVYELASLDPTNLVNFKGFIAWATREAYIEKWSNVESRTLVKSKALALLINLVRTENPEKIISLKQPQADSKEEELPF